MNYIRLPINSFEFDRIKYLYSADRISQADRRNQRLVQRFSGASFGKSAAETNMLVSIIAFNHNLHSAFPHDETG